MVSHVVRSETPSFNVKNKFFLWLLIGYSLVTRCDQTFPSITTE